MHAIHRRRLSSQCLQLPPHHLVQVLRKVPHVVTVQPRHRDAPVLRQVDVRLLRQRLALRRADPGKAVTKRNTRRSAPVSTRHPHARCLSHASSPIPFKSNQTTATAPGTSIRATRTHAHAASDTGTARPQSIILPSRHRHPPATTQTRPTGLECNHA